MGGRAREQPPVGPAAFVCVQEQFFLGTEETEGPTPIPPLLLPALLNGRGVTWGVSCEHGTRTAPYLHVPYPPSPGSVGEAFLPAVGWVGQMQVFQDVGMAHRWVCTPRSQACTFGKCLREKPPPDLFMSFSKRKNQVIGTVVSLMHRDITPKS